MCIALLLAYEEARELCEAAGFTGVRLESQGRNRRLWVRARRARTLPDWIRPGLRLLVCGLNPSLYAADAGVPFARPGNRFWGAAQAARLIVRDRDPFDALTRGVGFTDCAKRATRRASALRRGDYVAGLARLERQIQRYRPRVTCFIGLEGWRRVHDRHARAGWVSGGFGGRPAYLMPSTSGLNAHSDLAGLTAHLQRALRGP